MSERQMKTSRPGDLVVGADSLADPHAQLRYDLTATMAKLEREYDCNFVIMGDFNVNLNSDTSELRETLDWESQTDVVNVYLQQFSNTT